MYSKWLPEVFGGAMIGSEFRPLTNDENGRVLVGPIDYPWIPDWVGAKLAKAFPLRSLVHITPLDIFIPEVRTKTEYLVFLHLLRTGAFTNQKVHIIHRDYMEIAGRFHSQVDGTMIYRWLGESSEHQVDTPLLVNLAASGMRLDMNEFLPQRTMGTTRFADLPYTDPSQKVPVADMESTEVINGGDTVVPNPEIPTPPTSLENAGAARVGDLSTPPLRSLEKLGPLEEAVDWENIDVTTAKTRVRTSDEFESYLLDYVRYNADQAKVPLLVGNTAVAKSALVKSVVQHLDANPPNKWGYRLVDFRCAFVDKSDVEGFVDPYVDQKTGEKRAAQAPMKELTVCTDGFIQYARSVVNDINKKLDDPDIDDDTKAHLVRLRDGNPDRSMRHIEPGMAYYAKTPILFFDEVTRSTKAIRNVFTTILNQKKLDVYSMKEARMVAATNEPIDLDPRLSEIYQTEELEDKANLERFERFIITEDKVFQRWKDYISDPINNWHPWVASFIGNDVRKAYNIQEMNQAVKNGKMNADDARNTPFANFRTWEFVSQYLNSKAAGSQNAEPLSRTFIQKTIGAFPVTAQFLQWLGSKGVQWEEDINDPDRDEFTAAIRNSLKSRVPLLMAAPTSYGKTTRLNQIADEEGAIVVPINLAAKDRTQIKGAPSPALMVDDVFRSIPASLAKQYKDMLEEEVIDPDTESLPEEQQIKMPRFHFPVKYTDFFPQDSIRDAVVKAKASGKTVILFFDEVNRANPLVLSAVFEAVSDNRFMGVQFPPGKIVVMGACNIGDNYGDVEKLDPAFAARFAIFQKEKYDELDAKAFVQYMKRKKWDDIIVSWFEKQTPGQIVEILTDVEQQTILTNSSSSRSWDDLNVFLKAVPANHFMRGRAIIASDRTSGAPKYTDVSTFRGFPRSWIGFGADPDKDSVEINGQRYPVKDVYDVLGQIAERHKAVELGQMDGDLYKLEVTWDYYITQLEELENQLVNRREAELKNKLGTSPRALEFIQYYQANMGISSSVKVEDLADPALIDDFLDEFSSVVSPDLDGLGRIVKVLEEYLSMNGTSDNIHEPFARLTLGMMKEMQRVSPSGDANVMLLASDQGLFNHGTIGPVLCDIITRYQGATDFCLKIFEYSGLPILQAEVDEIKNYYGGSAA